MKDKNPYKNHEHDGGDDLGIVDCLKCEKEMLWHLRNSKTIMTTPKDTNSLNRDVKDKKIKIQ